MIKGTQYIQLTLLMLLLFVLFQLTSISITFHEDTSESSNNQNNVQENEYYIADSNDDILLITGENEQVVGNIEQELRYLKRGYMTEKSLLTISDEESKDIKTIILASDKMEGSYDLATVQYYMKKGINVIFALLPAKELDDDWKLFLGIKELNYTSSQTGIVIFSGFFLGDKQEYKDLKVNAYDIKVSSTCKTYIAGFFEDGESKYDKDNMQDILWRNVYEGSQIYIVNGKFFQDFSGAGILASIFAQMYQDYMYPVINAKALLINNAPYLSQENAEEMQKIYARSPKRLFEDLILPDIIALSLSSENVPTFYAISCFDEYAVKESELDTEVLSILKRELQRIGGEIGLSGFDYQNSKAEEKVLNGLNLFQNELSDYEFQSLNVGQYDKQYRKSLIKAVKDKTSLGSIVAHAEEGMTFSYYQDNIVNIPIISEGFTYSDEENYKLNSMATALGVITHEIDLKDIVYPENEENDWSKSLKEFSSVINTYWEEYKSIESLNITDTSKHVSRFLDMSPHITISEDSILVTIEGFDTEAYFILRSEKDIAEISNGTYSKLEDGAYLICAKDSEMKIKFK